MSVQAAAKQFNKKVFKKQKHAKKAIRLFSPTC